MAYKVTVTQVFDTYDEWTKIIGTLNTLQEAEEAIREARKKYYSRTLVSYNFRIMEQGG